MCTATRRARQSLTRKEEKNITFWTMRPIGESKTCQGQFIRSGSRNRGTRTTSIPSTRSTTQERASPVNLGARVVRDEGHGPAVLQELWELVCPRRGHTICPSAAPRMRTGFKYD